MYTLRNFSKSYSGHFIIKVDQLNFSPGLYWIKGENGSGKTTLFKALAGLHPFDGEISFDDGISLRSHPVAYRKLVNYSEAEPLYPGFLTGKDLIHFVGNAKGMRKEQFHLIRQLGLDTYYENPCETYSSGMLKKLSVCLAFLGNPRVIILDEPLITLDEMARRTLAGTVGTFLEKKDSIVIISSHQPLDDTLHVNGSFEIKDKSLIAL